MVVELVSQPIFTINGKIEAGSEVGYLNPLHNTVPGIIVGQRNKAIGCLPIHFNGAKTDLVLAGTLQEIVAKEEDQEGTKKPEGPKKPKDPKKPTGPSKLDNLCLIPSEATDDSEAIVVFRTSMSNYGTNFHYGVEGWFSLHPLIPITAAQRIGMPTGVDRCRSYASDEVARYSPLLREVYQSDAYQPPSQLHYGFVFNKRRNMNFPGKILRSGLIKNCSQCDYFGWQYIAVVPKDSFFGTSLTGKNGERCHEHIYHFNGSTILEIF